MLLTPPFPVSFLSFLYILSVLAFPSRMWTLLPLLTVHRHAMACVKPELRAVLFGGWLTPMRGSKACQYFAGC